MTTKTLDDVVHATRTAWQQQQVPTDRALGVEHLIPSISRYIKEAHLPASSTLDNILISSSDFNTIKTISSSPFLFNTTNFSHITPTSQPKCLSPRSKLTSTPSSAS